jgi:hypothetical protein
MEQYRLILLVLGLFMFCIYWLIHGLISYWIHKDSTRRGLSSLGWVGSYLGLSFVNMLIWAFILLIPFISGEFFRVSRYLIISVMIAIFSIPSLLTLIFYSLSSRGRAKVAAMELRGGETFPGMVATDMLATDAHLENLGNPELPGKIPLHVDETTLGRGPLNHVCIPTDPMVSKEHAKIRRVGTEYELCDRGSENRTYIERDGIRNEISRAQLRDSDIIYLGPNTRFLFRKLY